MKRVNENVDLMQVFVMVESKGGMKINPDLNVKNGLIKDLFGIQTVENVNVINHVMLMSI